MAAASPSSRQSNRPPSSTRVNTDKDVFKVGDAYYMCFQGVWFKSATPNGPWEVADSIPKEIYSIPVSSPAHNVTYVTVEESNDDAVVFATAAAYTGLMVAWGCVVWGSGYYYPPYMGYGYGYPMYYGRYPSYGYSAWHNPWTGAYGRSMGVYGPYGGAGMGARYNPRTGTYARGAVAYGPNGARGVASAYNPRTGTSPRRVRAPAPTAAGDRRPSSRGDNWATDHPIHQQPRHHHARDPGKRRRHRGQSFGRTGWNSFAGVTGGGDVYAGRDGNVYKKQGEGWQKDPRRAAGTTCPRPGSRTGRAPGDATGHRRQNARCKPRPSTVDRSQLDRDSRARTEGAQRTRDSGAVRSGTASRPSSYRPTGGGGMSRGGGGGGRRR